MSNAIASPLSVRLGLGTGAGLRSFELFSDSRNKVISGATGSIRPELMVGVEVEKDGLALSYSVIYQPYSTPNTIEQTCYHGAKMFSELTGYPETRKLSSLAHQFTVKCSGYYMGARVDFIERSTLGTSASMMLTSILAGVSQKVSESGIMDITTDLSFIYSVPGLETGAGWGVTIGISAGLKVF